MRTILKMKKNMNLMVLDVGFLVEKITMDILLAGGYEAKGMDIIR